MDGVGKLLEDKRMDHVVYGALVRGLLLQLCWDRVPLPVRRERHLRDFLLDDGVIGSVWREDPGARARAGPETCSSGARQAPRRGSRCRGALLPPPGPLGTRCSSALPSPLWPPLTWCFAARGLLVRCTAERSFVYLR